MINVLIADDHSIVREGLKQIIATSSDLAIQGEANDADETLKLLRTKKCDVILLDISMPGRSGMDILKELKSEFQKLAILILSMYPEDQYAVRALKAGAAGYITKNSSPEQLITAIRKVAAGDIFVSQAVAERLVSHLQTDPNLPLHHSLSNREYQILCMIGSGKTATEIAEKLSLSIKTVSTYRSRLLEKMGMENNAQLTHYVIKHKLAE